VSLPWASPAPATPGPAEPPSLTPAAAAEQLSTLAKAGIGLGVAAALLASIVALVWIVSNRQRLRLLSLKSHELDAWETQHNRLAAVDTTADSAGGTGTDSGDDEREERREINSLVQLEDEDKVGGALHYSDTPDTLVEAYEQHTMRPIEVDKAKGKGKGTRSRSHSTTGSA
jgi:hypothetical protein